MQTVTYYQGMHKDKLIIRIAVSFHSLWPEAVFW